jgi:hypothetical protein
MKQLRVNAVLLVLAIAPLIFAVFVNLATGGSLAKALTGSNLWIFPFLVLSGIAAVIYNFIQIDNREKLGQRNKPVESIRATKTTADRMIRRLALTGNSESAPQSSQFDDPDYTDQPAPDASSDTVEGLVADLWAQRGGEINPVAYRAAWRLAGLIASVNVRAAIKRLHLTSDQLSEPRLAWLVRPHDAPASLHDSLDVVQGRIGYLLRKGGTRYLSAPSLAIDPYLAIALIVVRENGVYHSGCPVVPHRGDANSIMLLKSISQASHPEAKDVEDDADAGRESDFDLERLRYFDIGKLIRPELPHTNPSQAEKQSQLIRHIMRHFLTDELSAVLFDALPDATQARLAKAMLTASKWMSPAAWEYWARTGRSIPYESKIEVISDSSFAAAGVLVIGVIVLGCWQLVEWTGEGWSWYFSPVHLLGAWPGWLKAVLIIGVAVACVIWLTGTELLGIVIAFVGCLFLAASIVASPVVRIHAWISTWGTASTIVIGALMLAVLIAWLGYFYDDRHSMEEPVKLTGMVRYASSRLSRRGRFRPEHETGHADWCVPAGTAY